MASNEVSGSSAPPVPLGLRLNLSNMMFLQFAVWGAWFVALGNYLTALEFDSIQIGRIYATMYLGAIVSPLVVGQIADRYFSSERLMAVLHLGGAGMLYWMAQVTTPTDFYWVTLGYSLIYSPTLALSNSIAFTHLPDGTRDFPGVRVLGTIGWIVAGLIVDRLPPWTLLADNTVGSWVWDNLVVGPGTAKSTNQPLLLAAGFSAVLGVLCFLLPHTPPKGQAGDTIPFVRALKLLKEPSFAVFFGVSFIITIVLSFYYDFTGIYLEKKIGVENVLTTMSIGQFAEMLLLPLLPFFLKRWGMKWVLAVGMLAWGIRYGIFAIGQPYQPYYTLVIVSLALHGVCFDFFFAAGFIHVDNESPSEIRASAQALFGFLTYGAGMYLGTELSGFINYYFTDQQTKTTDWQSFWTVPAVGVLVSLAIFVLFFRMSPKEQPASAAAQPA